MAFIDPHMHGTSRTTDDYERLAFSGCQSVSEPAYWPGFNRSSADGFRDYFHQLTDVEPRRAEAYGIRHFTWLAFSPNEADNISLARTVLPIITEFLKRPNVLGIGEIGLDRVTQNEFRLFEAQVDLALRFDQLMLVHTPRLEDKYKGTKLIVDALIGNPRLSPSRVLIDHVEEHTLRTVLDNGFWAGLTLHPSSNCSVARAVDLVERFGPDRIVVGSGGDWGPSDLLAVPRFALEMKRRRHPPSLIEQITLDNPRLFFSQSPKFALRDAETTVAS